MEFLIAAFAVSFLGIVPLLVERRWVLAGIVAGFGTVLLWVWYWATLPSMVWPLVGMYGFSIFILWVLAAVIVSLAREDVAHVPILFPAGALVVYLLVGLSGCPVFRASDYAAMLGEVETSVWTQDVQPKDAKHVRLVPPELAAWSADKQLGEAKGAIGSQFNVAKDYSMIQIV